MKSGSQSAKSHILWDIMTAKKNSKHYNQSQNQLYYKYVYTHKDFVLMTGASNAEESADMHDSADIHRNNTEGIEHNITLRK